MYTQWRGRHGGPIWLDAAWANTRVHGTFSFRLGGVSEPPYGSLNVGLHVGDNATNVLQNRERCMTQVAGERNDWVAGQQVHGTKVHVVHAEDRGRGSDSAESAIPDVDGLITDVPEVTLVVMAADCVPILFYDPVRHAVGAAHSGWKGTVGHMARNVIESMVRTYGSDAADIRVSLGPSIRQCCYEVNHVVRDPAVEAFGTRIAQPRFGRQGKYLLSLQSCIRADLLSVGVNPNHIEDCGICTACHPQVLFSHRADGGRTGRQMGAVRLHV